MYARRTTRAKPLKSQLKKWPAPTAGWIANRSLSDPTSIEGTGAAVMDNFFPRSTSVVLRRGRQRYATLPGTADTAAIFAYRNGGSERLFAADATTIYDITNVTSPYDMMIVTEGDDFIVTETGDTFGWSSVSGLEAMEGFTSGDWVTAQFATTGGVYLVGVNGTDTGFIYDGNAFYPYIPGGFTRLNYDNRTTPFTVGQVVTGAISGGTATIYRDVDQGSGTGYLLVFNVAGGPFQDNEFLNDPLGGHADMLGDPVPVVPGVSFLFGGKDTSDMAYVWVFKNRLFFAEKGTMNAWYMVDADAVGGDADIFPLSGVFALGGALLFGSPWSMESSGDGGLSEQCVFVSSLGEVAVYQGSDPSDAAQWSKVGTYRIGTPLGKNAFVRGGGDLAIGTTVGLVPLSKAIALDITALNVATVSYRIADEWIIAVDQRGPTNWQAEIWPEGKMAFMSPPDIVGANEPVAFVSNTETGAWCRFTGWRMSCMVNFQGKLFFGSEEGQVYIAWATGSDDGGTYTGSVMPLFEDMQSPASLKVATVSRARGRATAPLNDRITFRSDFDETLPPAPNATLMESDNAWGSGIWGTSIWGGTLPSVIAQSWRSAGGTGYSLSVVYQVTSGSTVALDAELIELELLYTTAQMVT